MLNKIRNSSSDKGDRQRFTQGGAPSYKWVIIPLTTIDISPINHSEIGLICTNLANYGAHHPVVSMRQTHIPRNGGFLSHGGTPIAGWFILWKIHKWMIWGYPYFRKPPNKVQER